MVYPKNLAKRILWILLFFSPFALYGDIIHLRDGRKIEGKLEIVKHGGKKRKEFWIRLKWGKMKIKEEDILQIEKKPLSWKIKKISPLRKKNSYSDPKGQKDKKKTRERRFLQKILEVYKQKGFFAAIRESEKKEKDLKLKNSSPYREIKKKLFQERILEMEIPFFLKKAPFPEVLNYLKDTTQISFFISPQDLARIQKKKILLSYHHPGRKLYLALQDICQAFHLDWTLQFSPFQILFYRASPPKRKNLSLDQIRLTLQIHTTLDKWILFLKKKTGLSFVMDHRLDGSRIKVKGFYIEEKLSRILKDLLRPQGLDYKVLGKSIWIYPKNIISHKKGDRL